MAVSDRGESAGPRSQYAFGPAVRLAVAGSRLARRHFAAEFGSARVTDGDPGPDLDMDIRLWSHPRPAEASITGSGGYKTARWRLALSHPDRRPLRAALGVYGGPPSFALSLVQGYLVEPLVAIALARAGFIALPSAGVATEGGAIILMGRSGSGKSSVCMRLLARGAAILSDDQIILDERGHCWPYPRRFRAYPDLRETATAAWGRYRLMPVARSGCGESPDASRAGTWRPRSRSRPPRSAPCRSEVRSAHAASWFYSVTRPWGN